MIGSQPNTAFQHTAARRRLGGGAAFGRVDVFVSTHSRPKAAGSIFSHCFINTGSFNTQPPEGGWDVVKKSDNLSMVSTHSRPKAAGM